MTDRLVLRTPPILWQIGMGLALFLHSIVAHAQPQQPVASTAKESYEAGVRWSAEGDLDRALAAFERAYELKPHYAVLFNIGQLYSALGQPVEAIDALGRFLKEGGDRIDPNRRAEARRTIAKNEQRVGELAIEIQTAGAQVMVDGGALAPGASTTLRVPAGKHVVVASKTGFEPRVLTVEVAGGSRVAVPIQLDPLAREIATSAPRLTVPVTQSDAQVMLDGVPFSGGFVTAGTHQVRVNLPGYRPWAKDVELRPNQELVIPVDLVALPDADERAGLRRRRRTVSYVAGGAGLAMLAGSAAILVTNGRRYERWQDDRRTLTTSEEPERDWSDLANDAASIQRAEDVGIALAVGGVALLATSVYYWVAGRNAEARDSASARSPMLGAWRW